MNNHFKILAVAMIMALLLATAAVPLLAASGPGSSGSPDSGSNSGSGSEKEASSEDSTLKTDIRAKNGELKVEVRNGNDRLKAEVKTDNNKPNSEANAKTEAKGGFASLFSRLMATLFGKKEAASGQVSAPSQAAQAETTAQQTNEDKNAAITTAPGITINKSLSSGPGYPTGPLDLSVPATQLLLDRVGQAKGTEIKDRQYEMPLETIPPTSAAIPVTINGASYTATEVKVISNLKTKAGAGQHSGTIDVDIDVPLGSTLPAGHITLQYSGSAMVSGSTITSGGVFKTSKMTGVFAGLVSEGTYTMTITETGSTPGAPATVSITTTSNI